MPQSFAFLFYTTDGSTKSTGRKARVSQIDKEIPEALPIVVYIMGVLKQLACRPGVFHLHQ